MTQPGQDHRLRRQPHEHARGARRARLRHRHDRGRPRARHAVPAAAKAQGLRASTSRAALAPGVTAKDLILAIIGTIGVDGGTGHVIEYRGATMRALDMEERMTVCNMSIEAGARAGMIAPDETTYAYLAGRPRAPQGAAWERALSALARTAERRRGALRPRGRHRCRGHRADDHLRHQSRHGDPDRRRRSRRAPAMRPSRAPSAYMGLKPGQPIKDQKVNVVFLGSCTNGAAVGPARGGQRAARPAHRPRASRCWWCPARSR